MIRFIVFSSFVCETWWWWWLSSKTRGHQLWWLWTRVCAEDCHVQTWHMFFSLTLSLSLGDNYMVFFFVDVFLGNRNLHFKWMNRTFAFSFIQMKFVYFNSQYEIFIISMKIFTFKTAKQYGARKKKILFEQSSAKHKLIESRSSSSQILFSVFWFVFRWKSTQRDWLSVKCL